MGGGESAKVRVRLRLRTIGVWPARTRGRVKKGRPRRAQEVPVSQRLPFVMGVALGHARKQVCRRVEPDLADRAIVSRLTWC